jgi:hypothetical protein
MRNFWVFLFAAIAFAAGAITTLAYSGVTGSFASFRIACELLDTAETAGMLEKAQRAKVVDGVVTEMQKSASGPDPQGVELIRQLTAEAKQAMEQQGAVFSDEIEQVQEKQIRQMSETMKSSLQRDMEKGNDVESTHLFQTLLSTEETAQPLLRMIHTNLEIYRKQLKKV